MQCHYDWEPRKSHENSKKSPRKIHECTTNFVNCGSSARLWTVVQDLRILWNFGHQNLQGVQRTPVFTMKALCNLLSEHKSVSEASGLHRRSSLMFGALPNIQAKDPLLCGVDQSTMYQTDGGLECEGNHNQTDVMKVLAQV